MSIEQPGPDPNHDYNPNHYPAYSNSHVYFETEKTVAGGIIVDETISMRKNNPDYPPHANLTYTGFINAESIAVTFDGVKYICERIDDGYEESFYYGHFNDINSEYPFTLHSFQVYAPDYVNEITTNGDTTGTTHTIKIVLPDSADLFSKNIKVNSSMEYTNIIEGTVPCTSDQIFYNITTVNDGLYGKQEENEYPVEVTN